NLFPYRTVQENITDPLTVIQKQSKEAAIRESNKMLEKVGLLEQTYMYPQKLTDGEKRRVALAQALVLQPKIFLFDNPTAGLNEQETATMIQIIKAMQSLEMTMIIGTKQPRVAQELGERIVFLENGVITE